MGIIPTRWITDYAAGGILVVLTSSGRTTPPELDSYFCLAIDPLEPLFCVMYTTVIPKNTEEH